MTAVAQLNSLIQDLVHPKQLLSVLLTGRGGLNVMHLTTVAAVLARMAGQSQLMQDPAYKNKVGSGGWFGGVVVVCHVLRRAVLSCAVVVRPTSLAAVLEFKVPAELSRCA